MATRTFTDQDECYYFSENGQFSRNIERLLDPGWEYSCDLSLFVSCYNEEELICETLETVLKALNACEITYEIIIIDDRSTDHSVDRITDFIATHEYEPLVLKRNSVNRGLGRNFFDSIFLARGKYFRMVCGDNVETFETLQTILDAVGTADLIMPYHTETAGKSKARLLVSRIYTRVINLASGLSFHYYNGLPVFKRNLLMRCPPRTSGFGFQADIVSQVMMYDPTCIEVPVKTVEKKASTALTLRNLLSVSHVLVLILLRRASRHYHRVR